ncbi:unnamed protein product [Rotaria sp. Silwood2]|nr:unnamed protein product [Rotaria sp. Silwood2]
MKSRRIEKLLHQRKVLHDKKINRTDNTIKNATALNNEPNHKRGSSTELNSMTKLTKRKRDISLQDVTLNTGIPNSTSSISIALPKLKKMKIRTNLNILTTTFMNNTVYKHNQSVLLYQSLTKL